MDILNFNRFYYLLNRQVVINGNTWILALLAFCGPVALIAVAFIYFQHSTVLGLKDFLLTFFMIGGFIFSCKAFVELQSPQKSYAYLTLPVSNLERVLVSWFLTSPIYVLMYSVLLGLMLLLSNSFAQQQVSFMDLFDGSYLRVVGVYMVTQTIFLLGASHFRKNIFLKTILSLFLFSVLFSAIVAGLSYLFLFDQAMENQGNMNLHFDAADNLHLALLPCLSLFFLTVTYFKIKEREI